MYEVLKIIRFEEVITTKVVTDRLGCNRQSACNNLNRLVKVGLLDRIDNYKYQGRTSYYEFTPVGIELYDKLYGDDN